MCGISVLVDSKCRSVDPAIVAAMNARVIHRGPDDEGVFVGQSFALGHRRLSILDLSAAGHQPMAFRDRTVVTYNGEIYNYVELRAELTQLGYEFHTTTDTEVLLAAYDCWGEECVRRFNGMWAFVLFDRRRNILFCSRDRFGVKPLHYVEIGDLFAIASEVKQFLAVPGFVPKADPVSVYRFLIESRISIDERGFFDGVRELRGGHNLRYDLARGRFDVVRWYDLGAVRPDASMSFEEASERFRELFFQAVRLRLRSDVSVGSCLSGGVDSSSIVSVARAVTGLPGALSTVFCGWDDPSCDESRHQEVVTRATGFASVVTRPKIEELLTRGSLDRIIYHQDQPIPSTSHFAEFAVFEAARAHGLVVMLDGQGADEYLAGYGEFFAPFIEGQLRRGHFATAIREMRRRSELRGSPLPKLLRSLLVTMALEPLRAHVPRRSALNGAAAWAGSSLAELARHVAREAKPTPRTLRELSLAEMCDTSIPYQLHSEDRNSMLHSIESRLPFLDYRVVELGFSLPDEFKIRDGATKAIVREGLRGVLPDAIRTRHDKVGFPAPEEGWIRSNAKTVRLELAAATEAFPLFLKAPLLSEFDAMINGPRAYDPMFFRVVALRRWAEVFNVS